MKNQQGFNLIELMVVVTIIGIIASVAIPSYQKNVQKSARSSGMTSLLDVMRAQENFFANDFTYSSNLTDLNYSNPLITNDRRYSISAATCDGSALTQCVLLTATAIREQVGDGNLTLDSLGNRTHNGRTGWLQ